MPRHISDSDVPSSSGKIIENDLVTGSASIILGSLPSHSQQRFKNPIIRSGADPWVTFHDGYYYYTHTAPSTSFIGVRKAPTLPGLASAPEVRVWQAPKSGPMHAQVWAPELHRIDGRWYLYFAACDGRNETHRMYVFEAITDDAQGEYRMLGKICDRYADCWAIDGTVLERDGKRYFVWSGWESDRDGKQNLYIAPMASPCELSGPRVMISTPEFDWETGYSVPSKLHIGVNEGPAILSHGARTFVVYSANGSWSDSYQMGLLIHDGGDVLDPRSWKKRPTPVFTSALYEKGSIYAPGHCSFVKSPDSSEDWIVYHTARKKGSGWKRHVSVQEFGWDSEGLPDFGHPLPSHMDLVFPSGRRAIPLGRADRDAAAGDARRGLEQAAGSAVARADVEKVG